MTTASSVALSSVLLFIARGRGRGIDALAWWGIAVACAAGGVVMGLVPLAHVLADDIGRGLLLLATVASWTAGRAFAGRRLVPIGAMIGPLIWIAACQIPAFSESDTARVALFGTIGTIYRVLLVIAIWPVHKERLPSFGPALFLSAIHTMLYAGRAILAITGLDKGSEYVLTNILLFEGQLYTVGMAFALVAMTKERAVHDASLSLDAARLAGDARGRFLAQMSHEVRTPMSGILGLTRLLSRDPNLRADQRHHVGTLETAGDHLLTIVSDALDLTSVDTGRYDIMLRPFSPTNTIEGCLALVREAAIEKRIPLRLYVDLDMPTAIEGDATRLRQIMLNLLWNALNNTPEGGTITISVRLADARTSRFEVRDTAPFIPAGRPGAASETAFQIDPTDEGTSLGLAISARIAAQMGGTLSHHPGPNGVGNMFRLSLPWPAATRSD